MAKEITFKVSKKGHAGVMASWLAPENLDDPRWDEVVKEQPDIHAAALRSVVIAIQSGARSRLSDAADGGLSEVLKYCAAFVYGVRQPGTGGRKAVSISAKDQATLKFTKTQRDALLAAGCKLPGEDDEEEQEEAA